MCEEKFIGSRERICAHLRAERKGREEAGVVVELRGAGGVGGYGDSRGRAKVRGRVCQCPSLEVSGNIF
jgi:hypothetical protein